MKIEIAESLLLSYLNHCKSCNVVQSNWKASSNWSPSKENYHRVEKLFDKIKSRNDFKHIFQCNFNQTIKQAEIDVIGIDIVNENVYAIDVANHSAGLNYSGGKYECVNKVLLKCLRTMLILELYFPNYHHVISFCSPIVKGPTNDILKSSFESLIKNFSDINNEFEFIVNDSFKTKIIDPTIINGLKDNDTSELFLRSAKLLSLFNESTFETNKLSDNDNEEKSHPLKFSLKKSDAISLISDKLGFTITNNVIFSNVNSTQPVWWLEPSNSKFSKDLYLLLNSNADKSLWVFKIPGDTIKNANNIFMQRKDKEDTSKLIIPFGENKFIDKEGFDFSPFLIKELSY